MRVLKCGACHNHLRNSSVICGHVGCDCIVRLKLLSSGVVGADALSIVDEPAIGIQAECIKLPKARCCLKGRTGIGRVKALYWVGEGIVQGLTIG